MEFLHSSPEGFKKPDFKIDMSRDRAQGTLVNLTGNFKASLLKLTEADIHIHRVSSMVGRGWKNAKARTEIGRPKGNLTSSHNGTQSYILSFMHHRCLVYMYQFTEEGISMACSH